MANIGSSFLGDLTRHRLRPGGGSTPGSTPPASPPPPLGPSSASAITQSFGPIDIPTLTSAETAKDPSAAPIAPEQSLELRLRWLEALVYGVKPNAQTAGKAALDPKKADTLIKSAAILQRRMNEAVSTNDGLRRFVEHCTIRIFRVIGLCTLNIRSDHQQGHLLTPAFALSGTLPGAPAYENMSPAELDAFLAELEPDIRAADHDMREIELLEQKGVTGAGKLSDYEDRVPRLDELIVKYADDARVAATLEQRISELIRQYATQVDSLSELFVEWDGVLREAEDRVGRLERDKADRARLGYV